MFKHTVRALVLAAVAHAATPAQAAKFVARFSGEAYVVDHTNEFGLVYYDEFGVRFPDNSPRPFTALMIYDPARGAQYTPGTFTGEYVYGGAAYPGTTNPVLYAEVTVNGRTEAFTSSQSSIVFAGIFTSDARGALIQFQSAFASGANAKLLTFSLELATPLFTLSQEGTYLHDGPIYEGGTLAIYESVSADTEGRRVDGFFTTHRVDIAAIPEPSTWTLMIGGFGLAGAALRRRERSQRPIGDEGRAVDWPLRQRA